MSALNQVEHAFRLADTALPGEEHTDTEHVGEGAVQRGRRRELVSEIRLDEAIELRRLEPRAYQRDPGGLREVEQGLGRIEVLCDERARDRKPEELLEV